MDTPIETGETRPWRVVHPILASGVPIEPGAAVILSPAEAARLAEAGYIEALDEVRHDQRPATESDTEAALAAAEALTPPRSRTRRKS